MRISSWHVGISAEAYAAAILARYGYDVSVQYGANQPEYDLIAHSSDKMLKVSVKGSQDGRWGLAQGFKKGNEYHDAIKQWLLSHGSKTIFCLVQFKGISLEQQPRFYLATPTEIAERLKTSAGGRGATILYENHQWGPRATGAGTIDRIPPEWKISEERLKILFEKYGC